MAPTPIYTFVPGLVRRRKVSPERKRPTTRLLLGRPEDRTLLNSDPLIGLAAPSTVPTGDPLTYAITVTNVGLGAAQNVTLTDAPPMGESFSSQVLPAGASGGPYMGYQVQDNLPALAAGASATFDVIFLVAAGDANNSVLTGTATAGATGAASASASTTVINLLSTTTTLSSSADPSTFGQSITLTTTVSSGGQGTPTGPVDFLDGDNVIGTGTLSNGQATLVTSALTVGVHFLSAAYQGDSADAVSTSFTADLTVQQASTTTTLTSSANPSDIGQAVTLTAEVDGASGDAPTGTITFMSGTTTLGTGTLSPGGNGSQATLTLSTLPTGSDPVIAVYGGDANYGGSSSTTLNQIVENNGAFVWTGDVSEDWDVAGNWLVDGQTAATDPGQTADVIFSGVGETDPNCYTDGAVSVNSLTLDAPYTGTLSLAGSLNVAATFDFEGGNVNQPGGAGVSDITVTGTFNWAGGVLNVGSTLGNIILNNSATLTGTNLTTGDNLVLDGMTLSLSISGNLTFNNNAGVTMNTGLGGETSLFRWDSKTANIVTTGTGMFVNNGGTLLISTQGMVSKVTSDLPYDGEGGSLRVNLGTIVFDRAGATTGVSVLQNSGNIFLGQDNKNLAILEVDQGLTMNGGGLFTAAGETSQITVGDVKITGGVVNVGDSTGTGELDCAGKVTMTGGTYAAYIDLTAVTWGVWQSAKGFSLGGTAVLTVHSLNIPAVLPRALLIKTFLIMQTPAVNDIAGDFAVRNLAVGATGLLYKTAQPDAAKQNYDVSLL